jgi:hypothetical protein
MIVDALVTKQSPPRQIIRERAKVQNSVKVKAIWRYKSKVI